MAENSQDKRVVDLIATIDSRLKKVHTQSLDLSFNELLDMKKNGELNITPDFQSYFNGQKGLDLGS